MAALARPRWYFLGIPDVPAGPAAVDATLRTGYLSRHVMAAQMASKGNGEVRAQPALLARLDVLADRLGEPIPILSGYRDPAHNAAIGGARTSMHMFAAAADIDESYGLTIALADELGFSGRGNIEGTDVVVHVDVRGELPDFDPDNPDAPFNTTGASVGNPTTWTYPA